MRVGKRDRNLPQHLLMLHSDSARARAWTCVDVHPRTYIMTSRTIELGSICAWCCVIFAATSHSIAQYQHNLHILDYYEQLQRHASTDVHARGRTITYADVCPGAWSYVRARGSALQLASVHARARALCEWGITAALAYYSVLYMQNERPTERLA